MENKERKMCIIKLVLYCLLAVGCLGFGGYEIYVISTEKSVFAKICEVLCIVGSFGGMGVNVYLIQKYAKEIYLENKEKSNKKDIS